MLVRVIGALLLIGLSGVACTSAEERRYTCRPEDERLVQTLERAIPGPPANTRETSRWPRCWASIDSLALAEAIVAYEYESRSEGALVVDHYRRELARAGWTESASPPSGPGTVAGTLCFCRSLGEVPAGLDLIVPPGAGAATYSLSAGASRWVEVGNTTEPARGDPSIACAERPSTDPSPT
jgi:hypothetical protein